MERKLRFLEKEIKKDDIPMLDAGKIPLIIIYFLNYKLSLNVCMYA